jgi:hypothetical protein
MRLSGSTLTALVALAAWFSLDFVGVHGLVDREPLASLAGLMLALMVIFFVAGVFRVRYTALVYSVALLIWLWFQIDTHWSTYIMQASQPKLQWYERVFGNNFRVLPSLADHTTPDAFHTLLGALIVLNLFLATRNLLRSTARDSTTAGA